MTVRGERVRVLVGGTSAPSRTGVRVALEAGGVEVCAEVTDADEALTRALRDRPDLCLLDADLAGGGLRATAAITASLPDTSVVVLAAAPAAADLLDALRAGASGYLGKDLNPQRLPYIVLGVLRGEAAVPRWLVTRLIDEFRARGRRQRLELPGRSPVELTDREWEVVQLLRGGHDTAEIGRRLFVSQGTVRTHVASIVHKLGVADRDELLRLLAPR
jgi:DNA-binding NarL/FixJ family response regulator